MIGRDLMDGLILAFLCLTTVFQPALLLNPVVLIPGDGGNQMDAKLNKTDTVHWICDKSTNDYFTLWLNIEEFIEVIIDCWVDNAKLTYNNVTRKTENQPGVETLVPGWGDTFTVEWLDPLKLSAGAYFSDIATALVGVGYERNFSLRGAPFDFRKAPNELEDYFVDLKTLIEETYEINNQSQIVMVAHSMGAPMSRYFLAGQTKEWKSKYIRNLITLSGAWAGSFKSLKVFYMGDDLGVFVLPSGTLKEMQKSMPSIAWLLPWPQVWNTSQVLVETSKKNYSLDNLQEYFTDIGFETGWEMTKDQFKYWDLSPPGVEIYCLHGYQVDTAEKMIFADGTFPGGKPTFDYGDGDGTVNSDSLQACKRWDGQEDTIVHWKQYKSIDHQKMLHDAGVVQDVVNIIMGKTYGFK